jgi:DNA primase
VDYLDYPIVSTDERNLTMEFNLLDEMQRDGFSVSRKSRSRGGQYNGPCILDCGGIGNDRLWVQPNFGDYGWFRCNVCGAKGSGVDYLMMKRGWSKQEALKYVGWKPRDGSEPQFLIPKNILAGEVYPTHEAPPAKWQEKARAFVDYCRETLWSEKGQGALDYLRARGLKDETIKVAQLGYNPAKLRQSADKWGLKQHSILAPGIVIPWVLGENEIWRITIRDETTPEGSKEGRYKQVAGGSNGLYFGFLLSYDRPVILVEGEFDALSIAQECGHHVAVCATGTTEGSRITRWLAALAVKDMVLVAFDAEESGDKAADWWLKRLENARRLRPFWKDANQMLQDGVDLLNEWIVPTIDSVLYGPSSVPVPSGDVCHGCGCPFPDFEGWDPSQIPSDDVIAIDPVEGELYCEKCRPDLFEMMRELATA